jgi:hypothetical protein
MMPEDCGTENRGAPHGDHDQHKNLYHWIYVAGFTLITAVVDFMFLWPENHLAALLVLAATLSLVAIYELTVFGCSRYWIFAAVIGLFAIAGIANWRIKTPPAEDRPRLSISYMQFPNGPEVHVGPVQVRWEMINSGKIVATISKAEFTPLLITANGPLPLPNKVQLPDKPIYTTTIHALIGMSVPPNVPFHAITSSALLLGQTQVNAINMNMARLFFYGHFIYSKDAEFAFIAVYRPDLKEFVRADEDYPSYSRVE